MLDPPEGLKPTSRNDFLSKREQWLTGDLLSHLKENLPDDAYCLLGVCLTDLYPGEDWNYVFGIAHLKDRFGVYSFARYDPQFYGEPRNDSWREKMTERSLKVLAHEACHMLGMWHCTYYNCLMNGSNNLAELDRQNSFLCPICLRKLEHALGSEFDLKARFVALKELFGKCGLPTQSDWIGRVLDS